MRTASGRETRARRLAWMEFRHALNLWRVFDGFRYAGMSSGWSGCLMRVAGVAIALFFLAQIGVLRGMLVDWRPGGDFAPRIIPWLLWALAGLYVAVAAMHAGWATQDRPNVLKPRGGGPPMTDLLPITAREAVLHKLLGRGGALLVHLLIGFVALVLARWLMLTGDVVTAPPSLADPWLVGAPLLFVALFVASVRITEAARRWYRTVALSRSWSYGGAAILVYLGSIGRTDLHSFNELLLEVVAVATALILFLAALQGLAPVQWLELRLSGYRSRRAADLTREVTPGGRGVPRWVVGGAMSLGLRGLGGMRGQDLLLVGRFMANAAGLALLGATTSALLQLAALAWVAASEGGAALPGEDLMGFLMALPAFAVFGIGSAASGAAVWSESAFSGVGRWAGYDPAEQDKPHLGAMLPVAAARVWAARLVSLLLTLPMLMIGAAVCLMVSEGVRGMLDPRFRVAPDLGLTLLGLVMAATAVLALILFLVMPMIERARKLVPISLQALGCAGWAALWGGLMVGIIALPLSVSHEPDAAALTASRGLFGAAVLWLVLSFPLSAWIWRPTSWPVDADGGPSARSTFQAVASYGWVFAGLLFAGLGGMSLLRIIH